MSREAPRIAVVGGGITGAFAAYFLARLGARPLIIERGTIAGQASGVNAGGLNPLHGPGIPGAAAEFALASFYLHLEHRHEIATLSQVDFGFEVVERLHLARSAAELDALGASESMYNATSGFSAHQVSAAEARRREPRLAADLTGALWTRGNARVDPHAYTTAVAAAAVKLGARVLRGEAQGLQEEGHAVTGVRLESGVERCDAVVVAPGPFVHEPARWLGVNLPVEPLKGELLLVEVTGHPLPFDVTWGLAGAYSAGAGRVWLGGTEDAAGLDPAPTESGRARIVRGIEQILPGLGPYREIRHTAGLRPVTGDGLPIFGIPDGWSNVCVAAGSGRKGMLFGAGLGLAAAELLTAGSTGVRVTDFSPARFGVRA